MGDEDPSRSASSDATTGVDPAGAAVMGWRPVEARVPGVAGPPQLRGSRWRCTVVPNTTRGGGAVNQPDGHKRSQALSRLGEWALSPRGSARASRGLLLVGRSFTAPAPPPAS